MNFKKNLKLGVDMIDDVRYYDLHERTQHALNTKKRELAMNRQQLQAALKPYKAQGLTTIKLNAKNTELQAEYDRLTNSLVDAAKNFANKLEEEIKEAGQEAVEQFKEDLTDALDSIKPAQTESTSETTETTETAETVQPQILADIDKMIDQMEEKFQEGKAIMESQKQQIKNLEEALKNLIEAVELGQTEQALENAKRAFSGNPTPPPTPLPKVPPIATKKKTKKTLSTSKSWLVLDPDGRVINVIERSKKPSRLPAGYTVKAA